MGWPLPPFAAQLLGRSHGVDARVLASVNGSSFVLPLPLVDGAGTVTVDGGSPARRTLKAEVHADVDDPRVDALAAELRAEYGIVDPTSGVTHWVPVGTFVVTEVQQAGPGTVAVTGVDRWQRVADARLERPITTSGNTLAAIVNLLRDADSRITVDTTGAASTATHGAALWEDERTEPVTKLAESIGHEVFFNPVGVAVVRVIPGLGSPSVWEVGPGDGGVKVGARSGKSRARTYNAVAVVGEPDGAPPVYAVARDDRPGSPTRWGGPMGRKPRRLRSPLIRTQAQANTTAAALLSRYLGVARTLQLETLPHPGLDAGDVITAEVDTGVWQRHTIDGYELPLGLGSGSVTLATRSTAGDEDE